MWKLAWVPKEEGLFFVVSKKRNNLFVEEVLGIDRLPIHIMTNSSFFGSVSHGSYSTIGSSVTGYVNFFSISKEKGRVEAMTPLMVIVSIVVVPSMSLHALWSGCKPPFELADLTSYVTGFLGELGQEDIIWLGLDASFLNQFSNFIKAHRAIRKSFIDAAFCDGPLSVVTIVSSSE